MRSAASPSPSSAGVDAVAVGALISAFVFAPLGVVLGLVAHARMRRSGAAGAGLATAAIVIGALVTLGLLLLAN